MDSKLSRWCDGVIEASWLAAIILTPLFFNIHSDRVFEPDKLSLLRSIALLMLGLWTVKFIDQKGWTKLRSQLALHSSEGIWRMPFIAPALILIAIYLISNVFSVTPSISWAGSYQRLQGTYTTLSYIVIFLVTISTMRTNAQARRLVTAVIITSIPVSFYGLLQHFDLDPLPWAGDTTRRVAGHMGNAIFIAAYLIMAVPLTLSRIIVSFNNILNDEDLSPSDVIRSSIYIFTLAIQLITIYWSGSRGPWIGIFAGLFAFVLIVLVALRNAAGGDGRFQLKDGGKALALVLLGGVALFVFSLILRPLSGSLNLSAPMSSFVAFVLAVGIVILAIFIMIAAQRGWRWLWLSWIFLSVVLGIWLVAFNLPSETTEPWQDAPVVGGVFETLGEWRSLSTIGRLGTVLEADSGTGRVRTLIWEGVLDLIAIHEPLAFPDGSEDSFNFLRPLIGYGPESMYVAYNRFYPPELATIEARNASPDRSHNETFDALVITGWFGLLAWQFLYLSVFYFGFKWLGVLNSRRDQYILIGFWIGFGALVAILFNGALGPEYLGVAFPFGSILGLILYLIYFALFGKSLEDAASKRPFATNRMLMVALVSAILAHYVEIHFGIAIASSRTHFFLYVGLMFVIGYLLPSIEGEEPAVPAETAPEETKTTPKKGKKGRGRRTSRPERRRGLPNVVGGPLMLSMFILTLIVGTIGFQYTTYNQPPERQFSSAADLPIGEIINQSFFVDAGKGFVDSPFIFVMLALTWGLGTLLIVSEMVKDGELEIVPTLNLTDQKRMVITAVLIILGLVGLGVRFVVQPPIGSGSAFILGRSLLSAYGAGALIAAILLYIKSPSSQFVVGVLSVIGLSAAFPILMAGAWWQALILIALNGWLFMQVRDGSWGRVLTQTAVLAVGSFGIGVIYTYMHAWVFRNSLFFQPTSNIETLSEYRILESSQAAFFITLYFLFVFALILGLGAFSVAGQLSKIRQNGASVAYISLIVVAGLLIWLVPTTNMQVVQADMIFKRGRFFDGQASSSGDPDLWLSAVAIYNRSINLAPREDYYYLFLGRAYLENSAVVDDPALRVGLLDEAEGRLIEAQKINPLNTDHTANLARLNTRRFGFEEDAQQQTLRIETAESYYNDALALSPQNSIIRNEYARLVYDLQADCDRSISIFEESVDIDPYFSDTYFWLVDTYVRCAQGSTDTAVQASYYQAATDTIEAGLEIDANNARAWLRASQLYSQLGEYESGIAALDRVRELDPTQQVLANWNYDFSRAQMYSEMGETDLAVEFAQQSLVAAPPEITPQIQQFIAQLTGEPVPIPETEPDPNQEETSSTDDQPIETESFAGERPLATISPEQRNGIFPSYPNMIIDLSLTYDAIINTEKGPIRLRLFDDEAPLTVNNFVYLANQGFYDWTTFHRVIEGFMAQAGDPSGTGAGGPGYQFEDETDNGLVFDRPGLLAMANAGPNTNGSQFFITFVNTEWLDGNHTIFGELIEGQEVLDSITIRDPGSDAPADLIISIEIEEVTP